MNFDGRRNATCPEHKPPVPLYRIGTIGQQQALQIGPRARSRCRGESSHDTIKLIGINIFNAGLYANAPNHPRKRTCRRPACQPMASPIVAPIAPDLRIARKKRIRTCIPGPDIHPTCIDHRRTVTCRDWVVLRIGPVLRHRQEILCLDQIIPTAIGVFWQRRFRRLGVQELVGLVRPFVDCRTAQFREPQGLQSRLPVGRQRGAHAAHTVMVQTAPPVLEILVPIHPWLPISAIGNRRSKLQSLRLGRRIVPVEPFSAGDIGLQVLRIVDGAPMRIRVLEAVAPIRQRHVIVDAHEIDLRVRPKRVQMEEHVTAAVLRMIAEILRPVGGIADADVRPQYRAHLCRQCAKFKNSREAVVFAANLGQGAHLRADAERIDPASNGAEMRIMQDEPPIARTVRSGEGDTVAGYRELRARGRPEESTNLVCRSGRSIRAAHASRCDRRRDPSPPWKSRLIRRPRPGIGKAVPRHLLHQDEGIEHHALAGGGHRPDRLDHRRVRRRPAIDRPPLVQGHDLSRAPRDARDRPRHAHAIQILLLDLGPYPAQPAAQIVSEPGHHQRDRRTARQLLAQRLQ